MAKRQARRAVAVGSAAAMLESDDVERVALGIDGFEVTVNGLTVKGRPSFDKLQKFGTTLRVTERASPFAIGDFILYIEQSLGEEASQILDYSEGWNEKSCKVYRWVSERVAPERRRMDRLTHKHHELVAKLSPAQQTKWLTKAAADNEEKPWSTSQLRAALKAGADVIEESWWVIVRCASAEDQEKFAEEMTSAGRSCKTAVRRTSKPQKAAA